MARQVVSCTSNSVVTVKTKISKQISTWRRSVSGSQLVKPFTFYEHHLGTEVTIKQTMLPFSFFRRQFSGASLVSLCLCVPPCVTGLKLTDFDQTQHGGPTESFVELF